MRIRRPFFVGNLKTRQFQLLLEDLKVDQEIRSMDNESKGKLLKLALRVFGAMFRHCSS